MMASAIKGSQWNHEMTEGLSSLKRKVWVELKLEAYIPWAEEAGVGTITVPVGFFFDVLMRLLYNFYSPLVFFVKVYEEKNTKSNPFCRNFCNEPLSFILHDFSQQSIHVNERYLFMSFSTFSDCSLLLHATFFHWRLPSEFPFNVQWPLQWAASLFLDSLSIITGCKNFL